MSRLHTILLHVLAAAFAVLAAINLTSRQSSAQESKQVSTEASKREFFESRIRPVLVEHCYECHNSIDANEGGFALDHREPLMNGGDGGAVIVRGNPKSSRLISILKHEIEGLEMPDGGPKLDDKVIEDFRAWIEDGAFDPRETAPSQEELKQATSWEQTLSRRKQWWSFQPIRKVTPPSEISKRRAIDQFVERRLQEHELSPLPHAKPNVLVRRLFFSLTGLPPSSEEITRWTKRIETATRQGTTQRDESIEQLVDHLLSSKHFPERWARHWMDWIRYAESHGSEGDPKIDGAWMYRDYLIRALEKDVPFDQLVREHVAGDLIENPRVNSELQINESAIGASHWRMVFHGFSPTDALEERVRFTDDQINAFSKAFLGLTISCARCHDHKFDAISQADYYALFGILNSCRPGRFTIDSHSRLGTHREDLQDLKTDIQKGLTDAWATSSTTIATKILSAKKVKNKDLGILALFQSTRTLSQDDGNVLSAWKKAFKQKSTPLETELIVRQWDLGNQGDRDAWYNDNASDLRSQPTGVFAIQPRGENILTGIYPAGVYSHLISQKLPGRLSSPAFAVTKGDQLWVESIGDHGAATRYVVQNYPRNGTIYRVNKLANRWSWQSLDLDYWKGDSVHVEIANAKDAPLLVSNQPNSWFGVRRVVIAKKGFRPESLESQIIEPLRGIADNEIESLEQLALAIQSVIADAIVAWRDGSITDQQALLLDTAVREELLPNRIADLPAVGRDTQLYRQTEQKIPIPQRVPGLDETRGQDQALMLRGNHNSLGDPVPRRFLEAIDATPYDPPGSGRRQLAEDLLRADNPFVRRVIVNRIWHHLFGRGIVSTPDNFGRLGNQPTHPDLLDWLALKFQEEGWSFKTLIKRIVMSETWRRSSTSTPELIAVDPENQWLARFGIRRLEAEAIRDSMLAASGALDSSRFGPPINSNTPRRSIYMNVIRNRLDPFLRVFDFPEPFSCVGRRDSTNVPAQSLALMNDPQVVRYAEKLATRIQQSQDLATDSDRLEEMFLLTLGRVPKEEELSEALNFLDETTLRFRRISDRLRDRQIHREALQAEVAGAINLVRQRASKSARSLSTVNRTNPTPSPIASWDFRTNTKDLIGSADANWKTAVQPPAGKSTPVDLEATGGLRLANGGYATTAPLNIQLSAKTLEAWVMIDNLQQTGAGVMTVQTPDGNVFDSIVFGERSPQRWLAGSDHFHRSEIVDGPRESEALQQPVHLAVSYHADGTIALFRDGAPYGKPYKSNGPVVFKPGETIVSFGVRHLPPGGNRMLQGKIIKANLYDRALSLDEITASAATMPTSLSDEQCIERMDRTEQKRIRTLQKDIQRIQREIDSLGEVPKDIQRGSLTELARAIFSLKEFIYVR